MSLPLSMRNSPGTAALPQCELLDPGMGNLKIIVLSVALMQASFALPFVITIAVLYLF